MAKEGDGWLVGDGWLRIEMGDNIGRWVAKEGDGWLNWEMGG